MTPAPIVIQTTPAECDTWLSAPIVEALALQRPLPDDELRIFARGTKRDPPDGAGEEVRQA